MDYTTEFSPFEDCYILRRGDESRHVSRVSRLLRHATVEDPYANVPDYVLHRVRLRGKLLHARIFQPCQYDAIARTVPDKTIEDVAWRKKFWDRFVEQFEVTVLAAEAPVGSWNLGYAGQLDAAISYTVGSSRRYAVIDVKPPRPVPDTAGLQTGLYRMAGEEQGLLDPELQWRRLAVVLTDSGFRVIDYDAIDPDGEDQRVIEGLARANAWRERQIARSA